MALLATVVTDTRNAIIARVHWLLTGRMADGAILFEPPPRTAAVYTTVLFCAEFLAGRFDSYQ